MGDLKEATSALKLEFLFSVLSLCLFVASMTHSLGWTVRNCGFDCDWYDGVAAAGVIAMLATLGAVILVVLLVLIDDFRKRDDRAGLITFTVLIYIGAICQIVAPSVWRSKQNSHFNTADFSICLAIVGALLAGLAGLVATLELCRVKVTAQRT